MKRLTALLSIAMIGCVAVDAVADWDPTNPNEFWVEMKGLICHVAGPVPRAVILHGGAIGMRHIATLLVPNTVKVSALRDATGQPVTCDSASDKCSVTIEAFAMRIARTTDTGAFSVDFALDPDFEVVPHLKQLSPNALPLQSLQDDVPSGAAAGFFDMTTGLLFAAPFPKCGGKFVDDKGNPKDDTCSRFPSWTTVHGDLKDKAVLQIRSSFTLNRWRTVPMNNSYALYVWIENRPANNVEDGTHITLYDQIFWNSHTPAVKFCSLPGSICPYAPPSGIAIANSSIPIFSVPGCDNTQFP